jgi:DNA-binding MarR family transcriptional regulator/GNAT superfamily N-acetyltransferase
MSVADVRRFNRTVTQRVGAAGDRFLGRRRPPGASRLLWEVGTEGCEVRALRSRLAIDSGQVSRMLRELEREGLVKISPSPSDRRIRIARLTAAGASEHALLDRRSDELAESILGALDDDEQAELVAAMRTVQRLLMRSIVDVRLVDPATPDARHCLRTYFAELDRRSPTGFDPLTSRPAEPPDLRAPSGAFLIAYLRSEPVGCGGIRHHPGAPSEIKRMWVAESVRGLGVGRRLLAELEAVARAFGAPATRLDTNRLLTEAIAMYRSAGYVEVDAFNDEPFAHHWFEKALS